MKILPLTLNNNPLHPRTGQVGLDHLFTAFIFGESTQIPSLGTIVPRKAITFKQKSLFLNLVKN